MGVDLLVMMLIQQLIHTQIIVVPLLGLEMKIGYEKHLPCTNRWYHLWYTSYNAGTGADEIYCNDGTGNAVDDYVVECLNQKTKLLLPLKSMDC